MGAKERVSRVMTGEQLKSFVRALEGVTRFLPARSTISRAFTVEPV